MAMKSGSLTKREVVQGGRTEELTIADPGSKRIDKIVNLARTPLKRRLIAFWNNNREEPERP